MNYFHGLPGDCVLGAWKEVRGAWEEVREVRGRIPNVCVQRLLPWVSGRFTSTKTNASENSQDDNVSLILPNGLSGFCTHLIWFIVV